MPSNIPIVVLREVDGQRHLPIWIGTAEANAIVAGQQGAEPPRPLTHDLIKDLLSSLGRSVKHVNIVEVRDNVFYANLVLDNDQEVGSRTSDAIAIALRFGCPIRCADTVLESSGIVMAGEDSDEEVERFREFLDRVTPEDFEAEGPAKE
jgi:bifunctional DNase/RNase